MEMFNYFYFVKVHEAEVPNDIFTDKHVSRKQFIFHLSS